jgi:hypothetical protein
VKRSRDRWAESSRGYLASVSELRSDGLVITAVSEVAGARTGTVLVLLHGATSITCDWMRTFAMPVLIRRVGKVGLAGFATKSRRSVALPDTVEWHDARAGAGVTVCELMKSAPFARRIPLFVGDDVTDESVFAVMPALGGFGYSVGREVAGVAGTFDGPQNVRDRLTGLCDRGGMKLG